MQVIDSLRLYANPHFAGRDVINAGINDISQLTPSRWQRLLVRFDDSLVVKVMPSTEVIEIRFRNSDPVLATATANAIIDEYVKRNFQVRVAGTAQVSHWLSKQLEEIRSSTTAAQERLADFQRDNGLLGVDESDNIVTDRLKKLNEELTQAEADRIVKEGRYRLALSGNPELIDSTLSNTTLQALRTQQADLEAQYSQLSSKFDRRYPKLRELQSQLSLLNAEIKNEGSNIETRLGNEFKAAAKAEHMIRGDFERQKEQAYKLNEHVAQYAILKHEVESGQQLYDTLQLKLKEAGIASGLTSSYVNVIDRAQVADKPVEPKKALYLALGLGGGLFGGLLLGFIRDASDDTVRTSDELESITALPELASVPFMAALANKDKRAKRPRPLLSLHSTFSPIALQEPNSPGVEAYRALCSTILLSSLGNSLKILVVTSATPGEGKSTVSCNLATALAQRGRNILLVDADMRCSSMHSQLGVRSGLSTMCAARAADHPRYQPIANLPNLHVVPAGMRPTDPMGVLDSARMQELMTAWRKDYDLVVIDTPPILPFADALVVAARADGVILVARSGISRSKALLRARHVLVRSGVHILGVVLNAVREPEYYYAHPEGYQQFSERDYHELPSQ
jgi:capsular exopolysaccharide synthesis family protein